MRIIAVLLLAAAVHASPVVRRQRTLPGALRAALTPLRGRSRPAPVLLVVDATPYTKAAAEVIGNALHDLNADFPRGSWRIARLGARPGDPQPAPAALSVALPGILDKPNEDISTLRALRATLRGFRESGGVVVYLADWRFEDDEGLERVVAALRRQRQTLSVVGSEAAFLRGWNDGFSPFGLEEYDDRIGRNAFRTKKRIPWHGGETAYVHVPQRFGGAGWDTLFLRRRRLPSLFGPDGPRGPEDLRERLGHMHEKSEGGSFRYPLPSSFGPYGLMRIADATGGRYVLWAWNRSGRATVTYDYTRCDRFAPDLRSRAAILRDVRRRPLARALNRAWHLVADVDLAEITPSFDDAAAVPLELARTGGEMRLNFSWPRREDHQQFLRRVDRVLDATDRALHVLDHAIHAAGEPDDPVDRRYLADAHLFHHVLLVQRFSLGEARTLAKEVDKDAWDGKDAPGLSRVTWIPETPVDGKPAMAHDRHRDKALGKRVLEERGRLLVRYRGTPFGEQARRNRVCTWEPARVAKMTSKPGGMGETPAFSDRDDPPPTQPPPTPPGGSSGGGPTSGG